jgi:hypothetical protein
MLLSVRIGLSTRSMVMMLWYPRLATSRSPGLLEVPATSSADGCWAPSSQDALSTCCLWSKQLTMGGQTLTCVICTSGISGLDLFFTTSFGFGLLGLGGCWVGQCRVFLRGWFLGGWLLRGWQLGGWSSRGGLWLIPHVSYRPNEVGSVILLHKSKRTGYALCTKDLHLQ